MESEVSHFNFNEALTEGTPGDVERWLKNGVKTNVLYDGELLLISYVTKMYGIQNKNHFYENIHLLLKYGADPDGRCNDDFFGIFQKDTPLHILCRNNCDKGAEIIKLLLSYGADLFLKNKNGNIPLVSALKAHNYEYIELLLTWPYKLAEASKQKSLLVWYYCFCTPKEKENFIKLLLILKHKTIKLPQIILNIVLSFIMGDSEKRTTYKLAQMLWNSDNPTQTASEIVTTMIYTPCLNNQTALDIASRPIPENSCGGDRKDEDEKWIKTREKIKKLLERYIV